MTAHHRIKALAVLGMCLFLVPLLAWNATRFLDTDVDAQWRALLQQQSLAEGVDIPSATAALVASCGSHMPGNVVGATAIAIYRNACAATKEVSWVRYLSAGSAALGLLLVGSIYGARSFAGTDRRRMSLVFGPVVRWVMVLLAMSTLAQAGLFIYGVLLVEVMILHGIHIGIVVVGMAGAALSGYSLLRASLSALKEQPLTIPAVRLDRNAHPALFALIGSVATRLQSDPPCHVVLGLDPVFFVTTTELRLAGDSAQTVLHGSTLYLSLSLMHLFSVEELTTVIGHEFAHLRGDDLIYSRKFAPMYARLRRATDSLNQPAGLATEIGRIPAIAALAACELEFAAAERTVGRQRELIADRAGAEVVDARTLAGALVMAALLVGQWETLTGQVLAQRCRGRSPSRLAHAYALQCERFMSTVEWPDALVSLEASVQPHPVDTHPPLLKRLRSLGVTMDNFEKPTMSLPDRAAINLLSGADTLDDELCELRSRSETSAGSEPPPDALGALQ